MKRFLVLNSILEDAKQCKKRNTESNKEDHDDTPVDLNMDSNYNGIYMNEMATSSNVLVEYQPMEDNGLISGELERPGDINSQYRVTMETGIPGTISITAERIAKLEDEILFAASVLYRTRYFTSFETAYCFVLYRIMSYSSPRFLAMQVRFGKKIDISKAIYTSSYRMPPQLKFVLEPEKIDIVDSRDKCKLVKVGIFNVLSIVQSLFLKNMQSLIFTDVFRDKDSDEVWNLLIPKLEFRQQPR